MTKPTSLENLAKEISEKRNEILDNFCRSYLASLDKKYFLKLKKEDFRRLELVQQFKESKVIFFFKLKKGRLPKISKNNKIRS